MWVSKMLVAENEGRFSLWKSLSRDLVLHLCFEEIYTEEFGPFFHCQAYLRGVLLPPIDLLAYILSTTC